jgi:hypothetical protein
MAFSVATHENSRFGSDPSTENRATTKIKIKLIYERESATDPAGVVGLLPR